MNAAMARGVLRSSSQYQVELPQVMSDINVPLCKIEQDVNAPMMLARFDTAEKQHSCDKQITQLGSKIGLIDEYNVPVG